MLKISLFPLALLASSCPAYSAASAQSGPPVIVDRGGALGPIKVKLDAVPKGVLVQMLMRDVMQVPYLIQSAVLQDRSPVSVNLEIPRNDIPVSVVRFIRSLGLIVSMEGGTVIVADKSDPQSRFAQTLPGQITPGQSLPGQIGYALDRIDPRSVAVLRPVHRAPSELVPYIVAAFPDLDVSASASASSDLTAVRQSSLPDALVLAGVPIELELAVELVGELDRPRAMIGLRVLVIEVRDEQERGSALQLLSDAVSGAGVSVSSYAGLPTAPQSITVSLGGLTAIAGAVREDGRFRVIAEPELQVESGSTASLSAGSQVPTLGAVSFTEGGIPVRSVEYRSSGLLLDVTPRVSGDRVHLVIRQERSSFSRTTSGVDDSPTLDQTTLSTSLNIPQGQTVALAGLVEASDSVQDRGIFGGLLKSKSRAQRERELIIVIEATVTQIEASKTYAPFILGPVDSGGKVPPKLPNGGTKVDAGGNGQE